ncbi:branched-chain amino acid transport system ATP-binding protein [Frankia sp. AiPs1]|uniref:ABC transporter ATP-binding protein n=1 Tax=Frankia sp. AiPa1 TaxID=573492 RepID=UPI00202AF0F9|nr:ABC transporter ATP-binding protein [Frankia sp. AiPa1]MCL9760543.1 ABC transporter ATP-binding protein [Frankia sp. AiPa1]
MKHVLKASGVTKKFAGITALSNVSMQISEGERVGLIGPNGAGKTTFFNCLLGVLPTDEGSVEIVGSDATGLPAFKRARLGLGRTFQRIELFPDCTVRDHLFIAERIRRGTGRFWKDLIGLGGPSSQEIARCDEVLELLGLRDLAESPVGTLSLGQGRLVEVGRALMTEPRMLLLDEPSSGLDRVETAALAKTLEDVQSREGFAILLVEHDVELVTGFTSRSYVLDFGRLIAEGPTREVMASSEVRAAYLGDFELPESESDESTLVETGPRSKEAQ